MKKFIKQLRKWYGKPVKGTHALVKFYLQASTFSFELHDERETCFTPQSLKLQSKVYYWDYDGLESILEDIIIAATSQDNNLIKIK